MGADIVSYARTRGLYAGISLEGSLLSSRSEFNQGSQDAIDLEQGKGISFMPDQGNGMKVRVGYIDLHL